MSITDEKRSFHPNEKSLFSLSKENFNCGRHGTTNHMMTTARNVFESCCATRAHTPNPVNAITMPIMLEGIIDPMLLKKSFLNIIWRATKAYCMELKTPMNNDSVKTRMTGMSAGLL